jgi:hypothetical protein
MKTLQNNRMRGKWAIASVYILLAAFCFSLVSKGMQHQLLQQIKTEQVEDAVIQANDLREQFLSVTVLVLYIITAIVFLFWFRRAYNNLHVVVARPAYPASAATSAWFIPFVNIIRPYRVAADLYEQTSDHLAERGIKVRLSSDLLGLWWFMWLFGAVIGQYHSYRQRTAINIDDYLANSQLDLINTMYNLLVCLVFMRVINDYRRAEASLMLLPAESASDNSEQA